MLFTVRFAFFTCYFAALFITLLILLIILPVLRHCITCGYGLSYCLVYCIKHSLISTNAALLPIFIPQLDEQLTVILGGRAAEMEVGIMMNKRDE